MKILLKCTCALFLIASINTGCASLGIKSTPWPNYTPTHDERAVNFLRDVPTVKSGLNSDVSPLKDYSRDDQEVIGITVSGGGMRAAAFALGIIEGLENAGLMDKVDFISTNSGGGWGVAAYLVDRATYEGTEAYKLSNRREIISNKFKNMSEGKIRCLHSELEEHITEGKTFGDLFDGQKNIPDHFINAALLPSETGFVFNKEHLKHFRVKSLKACSEKHYPEKNLDVENDYKNTLDKLSYGYAVATSGSVPSFYHTTAKTAVCDPNSKLRDSSFCSQGKFNASELHIVDGGIHDNHAYKTAAEIFSNYQNSNAKCYDGSLKCRLMIIDSTTNIVSPLIRPEDNKDKKLAFGFGTGSGFSGQDASAARLRYPLFDAQGIKTTLLDFFAAADLKDVDFQNFESSAVFKDLENLENLKEFITHKVNCFENDGEIIKADSKYTRSKKAKEKFLLRSKNDDCLRNNVYRAGTIAKTTYDYDEKAGMFPVVWELGVFVAKKMEKELKE